MQKSLQIQALSILYFLFSLFYYSFQFQSVDSQLNFIQYAGYILKRGFHSLTEKQVYSNHCIFLVSLFVSQVSLWILESIKSWGIISEELKKNGKRYNVFQILSEVCSGVGFKPKESIRRYDSDLFFAFTPLQFVAWMLEAILLLGILYSPAVLTKIILILIQ